MLRRILLPVIFGSLIYGFWISSNFKEVAAGVAIFLFGMLFLEEGFRSFTGGLLERLLQKSTDRLWKSLSFGIVSTSIMQSSSLISVITISFLSAGLLDLAAGVGIIFGANIGTTTGAWLVAGFGLKVKISSYAMPMLVFGVILIFQKSKPTKGFGYMLAGLGFLFLGIHYMKEGFQAFRATINLAEFAMTGIAGLLLYSFIGTVATVIMQSSHATLVLVITALAAGQITYENSLALAVGANIGTTVTAILGSLSSNYQGKRLALAHLIFNVSTGVVAIIFIHQFTWLVDKISVEVGIASTNYTLKLAIFHTLFNLVGVVLMVPLIKTLVSGIKRVIPVPNLDRVGPKYLNDSALDYPETMLEAVRNETIHLYDNAFELMAHGINLHRSAINSNVDLEDYATWHTKPFELDVDQEYLIKIKLLYSAIIDFISRAQKDIPPEFAERLFQFRRACRSIVKSVKGIKHMRKNICVYTASSNDDVKREYNAIRVQLGLLMRALHQLEEGHHKELDPLELESYKLFVEEGNIVKDGTLDRLIRKGRLTAEMGTSLMNDYGYARDAIWNLVEVGRILYGTVEFATKNEEKLLDMGEVEPGDPTPEPPLPTNKDGQ